MQPGAQLKTSPDCECGDDRQTVDHILLHCMRFKEERDTLIDRIEKCYQTHEVPHYLSKINTFTLLAPTFKTVVNTEITKAMAAFITAIDLEI